MPREIKLHGKVKDGVIYWEDHNKADLNERIAKLFDGKDIELVIKRKKNKRTVAQNSYLWGVVYNILAAWFTDWSGEETYTAETIHTFCKDRFLPEVFDEQPRKMIGPGGEMYTIPYTTTKLSTEQFQRYKDLIQRWAAETLDINIPDPNENNFKTSGTVDINRAA